jgi:hypothetical protein
MKYTITMISRQEIFNVPPAGHLGVLFYNKQPDCVVGETIEFISNNDPLFLIRGQIVAIEKPGQNIRPDLDNKDTSKWKIHWVPFDSIHGIDPLKCPRGCKTRSGVYAQDKLRGLRYRRCSKCHTRWFTKEYFHSIITSKSRRKNK